MLPLFLETQAMPAKKNTKLNFKKQIIWSFYQLKILRLSDASAVKLCC